MRLVFIVKEMYKALVVVPFKVTRSEKAFFIEFYVEESGLLQIYMEPNRREIFNVL